MKNAGFCHVLLTVVILVCSIGAGYPQKLPSTARKIYEYKSDSLTKKPMVLMDEGKEINHVIFFEVYGTSRFSELLPPLSPENNYSVGASVEISFIVSEKGGVEDVQILRSSGPEYTKIVEETFEKCPQWTPGGDLEGNTVCVKIVKIMGLWKSGT